MLDKVKAFVKKHGKKVAVATAFVAGSIVAYKLGENHVAERLKGENYVCLSSKSKKFVDDVEACLNPSLHKLTTVCCVLDVPRNEIVETMKHAMDELKDGCDTVNMMLVAK